MEPLRPARVPQPAAMQQLSSLDAQFLGVESARTFGHVGMLAVYDPSTAPDGRLEVADLCRLVARRMHLLPPLRRRLEAAPVRAIYRSRRTPSLVVVDKENGGKADALNVGLDVAGGELVCAIDSDTLVEADALQRMIRPFLVSDEVVAVGGTIRAVNGCEVRAGRVVKERPPYRLLPALQAVEIE